MASKKNKRTRQRSYDDKSIRSIDKNLDNSKIFDTKKLTAKHSNNDDSLEKTNVQEFHFDNTMLDDIDSLDTSFLEGSKKKKDRIVKDEYEKPVIYKNIKVEDKVKTKKSKKGLYMFLVIILSISLGGLLSFLILDTTFTKAKAVPKEVVKEKKVIDENILFLGDSLFDYYDLDRYYSDNKVVQSGVSGNTTADILDDMYNRAYRYNPSKVFILIGTNNLVKDISIEDTASDMKEIVKDLKKNRKLSDIYVISLLPVNDDKEEDKINLDIVDDRTNSDIKKINKEYKKICKDNDVTYVDVYDDFCDEDGRLKINYTKEGLHLSDEGYDVLTKNIKKYINK